MNEKIYLNPRLSAIRDMVPMNTVVADIGCDHGYLICSLVETGIAKHGFACEANPQPLERARKTIVENCLSNRIDTVLTNGLTDLPFSTIDVFVIAGMGGDLISKILLEHQFTRDSRFTFLLQPMSKPEKLRKAIFENGFTIAYEVAVISDNKVYSVMNVRYTDMICSSDTVTLHTGLLLGKTDFASRFYIRQVLHKLTTRVNGLIESNNPNNVDEYTQVIEQIRSSLEGGADDGLHSR